LQTAVASAAGKSLGIIAAIVGILTLFVRVSGEMQSALNVIWKAKPEGTTVSRLIRVRVASLGLVASLGFLIWL
jgi:membrane protein